jgi:hypothetical protein
MTGDKTTTESEFISKANRFPPKQKKQTKTNNLSNQIDPLMMTIDETFDIGVDTRTGVDDSYTLPFRFTGTIDKLTFKLGPSQLSAADKKAVEEAYGKAND